MLIVLSGALAYDAFTSYISPYLTVSQVVENSATYHNKEEIQVIGTVVNGSTRWKENGSLQGFDLTDEEYIINVTYTRSLPPGFNDAEQVVVIGKLVSPGTIEGYDMLVKCPSKYEGEGKSLLADPVFLAAILLGSGAIVGTVLSIVWKREQHEV